MTQSIHSALTEAQAPMHAPSASPPRTHAQASRDSHWTTPSGQRRPLPGDPCAESPPRPKAPQPGHADAPIESPQLAPSGESAAAPGDPCAELPLRPQAPQPDQADAPSEVPQSAPSDESEAEPSAPCAELPLRPQAPPPDNADAPNEVPQSAPSGESAAAPGDPCAELPLRPQAPQPDNIDAPVKSPQLAPSGDPDASPSAPCAELPLRPQAPQPGHADAPNEVPPSAPSGDPDASPSAPCAELPLRPQPDNVDAPVKSPQLAPSGESEAAPGVQAPLQRTAPPAPRPIGIILFERDKWAAACAGFDLRRQGRRSTPGGLPSEAVWIIGGSSMRVAELRIQKEFKGLRLHASDWFGPWFTEILSDWGLRRCGLIDKAMALSAIADRVVGLAERAAARFASASGLPASAPLLEAPSLAEGLRAVIGEAAPQPLCGRDAFTVADTFQRGGGWARRPNRLRLETRMQGPQPDPVLADIARRGGAEATMLAALQSGCAPQRRESPFESDLLLRVPRLEHAYDVFSHQVPADGSWRRERIGKELLEKAQFRALVATGLPVLVCARAVPKPGVPHDACIASWGASPRASRPREDYTLDEIAAMLETHEFRMPDVMIGPGWGRPPEADLLDALVESIGSRRLAHASWSAGLVAAAILDAAMGPAQRYGWASYEEVAEEAEQAEAEEEKVPEPISPASVWLAVRERIRARDRLHAMGSAGAVTYSGERGGRMHLHAWEDSVSRAELASMGWEAGLHMQTGPARRLHDKGHPPASGPASWGGGRASVLLAALSQRGDTERLWEIDQIACLPAAERAALRGTAWADMVEDAPWK